jgi:uncharacterized membrane protein
MIKEEMSVGNYLKFSVDCAKLNWAKLIGLSIFVGVAAILNVVLVVLTFGIHSAVGSLFVLVGIAVMITLTYGYFKNILNISRGEPVNFKAFFSVNPMVIVNYVVAMVIVFLAVGIGTILIIIPGIILAYKFCLVPFLIIDREMGAIEAMKESWKVTTGHFMDIFLGIIVCMIVANLITFVTLGIGMIFTIPMMCFVYIYPYLALTNQLDVVKKNIWGVGAAPLPAEEETSA